MSESNYVHGYSETERQRLLEQARFLAPRVFSNVDLTNCYKVLEVGCGVGAQTLELLQRFPHLKIDAVDRSQSQLDAARENLHAAIVNESVRLYHASADTLPFPAETYDGAFLCWVLEHVENPVNILREAYRCLQRGGKIYANEVFNHSLFLYPASPHIMQYWQALCAAQRETADPDVGAKLGYLFTEAGFQNVRLFHRVHHLDSRSIDDRNAMFAYWETLLFSARDGLLKNGRIDGQLFGEVQREFARLRAARESIFFYTSVLAEGWKP